jgi:hypothetical protein
MIFEAKSLRNTYEKAFRDDIYSGLNETEEMNLDLEGFVINECEF